MDDQPVLLLQTPSFPSHLSSPHSNQLPVANHQNDLMAHLDRLNFFLATAPSRWSAPDATPTSQQHPALNRFLLPSGEYVTCVLWSGLYHITGTDIVRALVFRFEAFGRPVRNMKKFEEGVFSDLRNLKPGHDACLEEPKSPFLDLLFKYQCIRTQKKQKVFYWFSVPHDRLFLDALERDLKREKMGLESTTAVVAEPALSFSYDPKRSLYEQFTVATKPNPTPPVEPEPEGGLARVVRQVHAESVTNAGASSVSLPELDYASARSSLESPKSSLDGASVHTEPPTPPRPPLNPLARSPFFSMFALFEGSPTYKQRRKKTSKSRKSTGDEDRDFGRRSIDSGRRSMDSGGRHSLDGGRPTLRSQPPTHTTFLAGPGQFGFTSAGSGFPPSAHVGRLAQQMRSQRHVVPLSAPTPTHACPLYTCRQVFTDAETLQSHMRTHEHGRQRADERQGDMDVDPRDAEERVQFVRGTQQLQYHRGSPEIPHFTHVLTTPDGSPSYDYEDEQAYPAPAQWALNPSESPAYSSAGAPLPSPGHVHGYNAYDTSSAGSASSPDAHTVASSAASSQPYYVSDHLYPSSAPSHRLTFDPLPPSIASAEAYTVRRPRSVTPSLPNRVQHARRPSTANEVPSSFGASSSVSHHSSWRHHTGHYASRGYHPYAVPVPDRSYSMDSTRSSHSSPDNSPFAVSLKTPAGEYAPETSSHAGDYISGSSPQMHPQSHQSHEYGAPPLQQPSPHLPDQFAHMVSLEGTSPVENMELTYPHDPEAYDERTVSRSGADCGPYQGSPENAPEQLPSDYQYAHASATATAEYASSSGSSTDGAMYPLEQMVSTHDTQVHQHYYEPQVA